LLYSAPIPNARLDGITSERLIILPSCLDIIFWELQVCHHLEFSVLLKKELD